MGVIICGYSTLIYRNIHLNKSPNIVTSCVPVNGNSNNISSVGQPTINSQALAADIVHTTI